VLMGFMPMILFGAYLYNLIGTLRYEVPPYILIGIVALVVWFVFGMISILLENTRKKALMFLNAPAFMMWLTIVAASLPFQSFEPLFLRIAHTATIFYLPLLRLGVVLQGIIQSPLRITGIVRPITMPISVLTVFLCLVGASFLGRVLAERFFSKTYLNTKNLLTK